MRGHVVVVGSSLAGIRAAETLRREGFEGDVTMVGAERHYPPYDRPPLSKQFLRSAIEPESIRLRVDPDLRADLHAGVRAVALDAGARTLQCDDGRSLRYDGLIIATGASARRLPGPMSVPDRMCTLRTVDDALRLRSLLAVGDGPVAIVGAGFIGSEVAATLRLGGRPVTVIDQDDAPMSRALGPELGGVVAGLHRRHGVEFALGEALTSVTADGEGLLLETPGRSISAQLAVVAIGAVPATAWLDGSGIADSGGVVCDEFGYAVPDGTVVAAGDVARWHNPVLGEAVRVEHWTNAVGQAQAAARNLLARMQRRPAEPYRALPYYWSDQYDWKLQFVGAIGGEVTVEEGTVASGEFVAAHRQGGRLVGALCVNRPARVARWRTQIHTENGVMR